jgi:hypothetical protein
VRDGWADGIHCKGASADGASNTSVPLPCRIKQPAAAAPKSPPPPAAPQTPAARPRPPTRDRHELLAEPHAARALLVLALVDAVVGGVIGGQVGAHHVLQLVLGAPVCRKPKRGWCAQDNDRLITCAEGVQATRFPPEAPACRRQAGKGKQGGRAHQLSDRLLDSSIAAPPTRKRQLGMSLWRRGRRGGGDVGVPQGAAANLPATKADALRGPDRSSSSSHESARGTQNTLGTRRLTWSGRCQSTSSG